MKRRRKTITRTAGQIDDPSEHLIQVRLLKILAYAMRPEIYCFAIPNQSNRHINNANKMKSEGLKRGISDLVFMLPAAEGSVAWMEMKTPEGSLSIAQQGFSAICARLGHRWALARTVDEALDVLRGWGILKPGVQII